MKSPPITKETLLVVKNIEKMLNTENRHGRLKSLEAENEFLRGDNERLWERIRAFEKHLGVEYIREVIYQKINGDSTD